MAAIDMLQDQRDSGTAVPTAKPAAMTRLTPIRYFRAFAGGLSTVGGILAALIMAFMTGHILYEIILRSFFSSSTYVLDEFVGYGVAAMTFLALGDAVSKRALIQVTFLIDWVRLPAAKLILRLTCIVLTFGLVTFLSLQFWKTISRNFTRGATSETMAQVPLWIPESLLLVGLVIFAVQLLADALGLFEKPENRF
ncbi:TRAP transporter small permease [Primorskyibacter flagellatus]|uniref:TRAP transporter small permease n=1 Tax=Primorskyibacter flagellatus TaxID=1387277 RepID=UPI003A8D13E9